MLRKFKRPQRVPLFITVLVMLYIGYLLFRYLHLPTAYGFSSFLFSLFSIVWAVSFSYRLLRSDVRRDLIAIAWLAFFYFSLREIKYSIVASDTTLSRYMWYLYYLPMVFMPFLGLMAAEKVSDSARIRAITFHDILLTVLSALLVLLVLTNDLHQWVFRFPQGLENFNDEYVYGIGYYVLAVCVVLYLSATILILVRSMLSQLPHRSFLLPIVPLAFLMVYLLLYKTVPRVFALIKLPEAFTFSILLMWECLIRVGLVRSNSGYEEVFSFSSVNAQIADLNGDVIYRSAGASPLSESQIREHLPETKLDENTFLSSSPIHRGYVFWMEDVSDLNHLRLLLMDQQEQLQQQSEILQAQVETKRALAAAQTKSRIYDTIMEKVQPQIRRINDLLNSDSDGDEFVKDLSWACVLNTYIKRRLNLALLSEQHAEIEIEQLALGLQEFSTYLNLCGVLCGYDLPTGISLPSERMEALMDSIEWVVENSYPSLDAFYISMSYREDSLFLRLQLEDMDPEPDSLLFPALSDLSPLRALLTPLGFQPSVLEEDGIVYLTISERGGEDR